VGVSRRNCLGLDAIVLHPQHYIVASQARSFSIMPRLPSRPAWPFASPGARDLRISSTSRCPPRRFHVGKSRREQVPTRLAARRKGCGLERGIFLAEQRLNAWKVAEERLCSEPG